MSFLGCVLSLLYLDSHSHHAIYILYKQKYLQPEESYSEEFRGNFRSIYKSPNFFSPSWENVTTILTRYTLSRLTAGGHNSSPVIEFVL